MAGEPCRRARAAGEDVHGRTRGAAGKTDYP